MPRIPSDQRSPYGTATAAAAKRDKSPSRNPRRHGDRGDPDGAAPALDTWLSFDDLRRAGIVTNRKTLGEWQRDPRIGFPLGRLLAPSTRRWSKQHDIDPWLASRPVERDDFDDVERVAAQPQPP
jgi:hypothetical protein